MPLYWKITTKRSEKRKEYFMDFAFCEKKPENEFTTCGMWEIYDDWFETWEEANEHIRIGV